MRYIDLLREHCRRLVSKKASPRKAMEMKNVLLRRKFFEDIENSKGKILLNFFKIHKRDTHHIKRYDIHRFIIDELKIPISSCQVSMVYTYLEELGADYWRNNQTIFYTNVSIKRAARVMTDDFDLTEHNEKVTNDDGNSDDLNSTDDAPSLDDSN